jgi:hypothetical protein
MNRGYSLVELILALLLLQVGVLAAVGTVHLAQEGLRRSDLTLRGVLEAARVADSLGRSGSTGSGRISYRWGEVVWRPAAGPLGAQRVVALSARDRDTLATFLALPPLPASFGPWASVEFPERLE